MNALLPKGQWLPCAGSYLKILGCTKQYGSEVFEVSKDPLAMWPDDEDLMSLVSGNCVFEDGFVTDLKPYFRGGNVTDVSPTVKTVVLFID